MTTKKESFSINRISDGAWSRDLLQTEDDEGKQAPFSVSVDARVLFDSNNLKTRSNSKFGESQEKANVSFDATKGTPLRTIVDMVELGFRSAVDRSSIVGKTAPITKTWKFTNFVRVKVIFKDDVSSVSFVDSNGMTVDVTPKSIHTKFTRGSKVTITLSFERVTHFNGCVYLTPELKQVMFLE